MEDFIRGHSPDERYAAGLAELAQWHPWYDRRYRPKDLEQLARDLLHAQTLAADSPPQLAALQEAADLVQQCRTHGWHLHTRVD